MKVGRKHSWYSLCSLLCGCLAVPSTLLPSPFNFAVPFCVAGLVTAVAAFADSRARQNGPAAYGPAIVGAGLSIAIFLHMFLLALPKPRPLGMTCIRNLKTQGTAMLIYADDHNGHLPLATNWCNSTRPELREIGHSSADHLSCPVLLSNGKCGGYAFNSMLSNARLPSNGSSHLLMMYESKPGYNLSGQPKTLHPRHRHNNGSVQFFADGHVRWSPRSADPYLICDPKEAVRGLKCPGGVNGPAQ